MDQRKEPRKDLQSRLGKKPVLLNKPTQLTQEQKQERLAELTEEYIELTRQYRREGVDVVACVDGVYEKVMLAWTRCFGLCVSILSVPAAPAIMLGYRVLCWHFDRPYDLPDWPFIWWAGLGLASMLGYGYNLVNPKTLERITGKPPVLKPGESKVDLTASGHWIRQTGEIVPVTPDDGSNGDV